MDPNSVSSPSGWTFNGRFRDECVNEHWFVSVADPKATMEACRIHYNRHETAQLARRRHASVC
jgi:hypothetical protein